MNQQSPQRKLDKTEVKEMMNAPFPLHAIQEVREATTADAANDLLKDGWTLYRTFNLTDRYVLLFAKPRPRTTK